MLEITCLPFFLENGRYFYYYKYVIINIKDHRKLLVTDKQDKFYNIACQIS